MNKNIKKVLKSVLKEETYNKLQDNHRQSVRNRKANEKKRDFHQNFREIMEEHKVYVMGDKTITPINIEYLNSGKSEGISCELKFPKGLSMNDLERTTKSLSQNVFGKCMILIEDDDGMHVRFSAIKKWHDTDYTPYLEHEGKKLTASQVFCGYNIMLEPIIIDMASAPHLLITGGSGGGKSKLVEIILTNLALANKPEDLNLYFLQIAKDDNFKFELLKHTKGCVTASSGENKLETLKKSLEMLRHIDTELTERGRLVKDRLGRKSEDINIHIYNKKFPNDKLPVIMLWVDEAASLYKQTSDKVMNKLIKEAQEIIERVASTGRYIGVYLVNVLQRASKEELPREIKINTMNWISFKQVDAGASKVAIGDETSALGLPQRVFAYKAGTEYVGFGKTPFSMWDKNVRSLELQDKIKEDNQAVFNRDYSHWLSYCYIEEVEIVDDNGSVKRQQESINKAKDIKKTKLSDDALKMATDKINNLEEKLTTIEYEKQMNDEVIKKLMEENKNLKKNVNKDIDVEIENTNNDESIIVETTIKNINTIEYVNADKQRTDIVTTAEESNSESSPYKSLDLSALKLKK